jgi:hypothetical protein
MSEPTSDATWSDTRAALLGGGTVHALVKATDLQPARPGNLDRPRCGTHLVEQLCRGPEGEELREAVVRREGARSATSPNAPRLAASGGPPPGNCSTSTASPSTAPARVCQRGVRPQDKIIRLLYDLGLCQEATCAVEDARWTAHLRRRPAANWRDLCLRGCDGKGVLTPDERHRLSCFFLIDGQWYSGMHRQGVRWTLRRRRRATPAAGPNGHKADDAGVEWTSGGSSLKFVLPVRRQEQKKQEEGNIGRNQMRGSWSGGATAGGRAGEAGRQAAHRRRLPYAACGGVPRFRSGVGTVLAAPAARRKLGRSRPAGRAKPGSTPERRTDSDGCGIFPARPLRRAIPFPGSAGTMEAMVRRRLPARDPRTARRRWPR